MSEKYPFLQALKLEKTEYSPVWMMRQAGRYLPEYRELRAQAPHFLDFCYSPDKACEVTIQPLRRFDFDAAILFSDILTIPQALGLDVQFVKGDGPQVEKVTSIKQIDMLEKNISNVSERLSPVFKAVKLIRDQLEEENFFKTALIGFCGAPWTVATYMFDEKPSKDTLNLRKLAYEDRDAFEKLMNVLVQASIIYLKEQIKAGAQAIQLFDSWASAVPHNLFEIAIQKPLLQICAALKAEYPDVPIILFVRNVSERQLLQLVDVGVKNAKTKQFDALGIGHNQDLSWAVERLLPYVAVQGNLDPAVLLTTPEIVEKETKKILEIVGGKPGFIFNLGHGITPNTPIENVEMMVKTVKNCRF